MVGVMVVVDGEEAEKSEYRKFKINGFNRSNDVGALKEMLERRFKHKDWRFPDVVVVDGSTAQKNAAETILRKCNLVIPVITVVKDDKHKPIRLVGHKELLDKHKDGILLANAEAHRFAITYHRSKQRKKQLG
jgi:excinuclease ABC subunit C